MTRGLRTAALIAAATVLAAATARAESRLEKTLKLEPGGSFQIETASGSVTVTGKTVPDVRIVVTSSRDIDDVLSIDFHEEAHAVRVKARRRHENWFGNTGRVHWEIEVPAETKLDIHTSGGGIQVAGIHGNSKLDTSGGGITVRDMTGDLEADTSGGPIRLANIQGTMRVETSGGGIDGSNLQGSLSANTSGGSISLDKVTGDVKASSSGGGIQISEAGGRVDADTSGGGIEASFTKGNAKGGTLETSGGGIEVAIDPEVGLDIDASGSYVKTDLPVRVVGEVSRHSLHGSLGKGGERLRLHTSGGGVRIKAL